MDVIHDVILWRLRSAALGTGGDYSNFRETIGDGMEPLQCCDYSVSVGCVHCHYRRRFFLNGESFVLLTSII